MIPSLYPAIICAGPGRCRAEIYMRTKDGDIMIYCYPAKDYDQAKYRLKVFMKNLRAAVAKLPEETR